MSCLGWVQNPERLLEVHSLKQCLYLAAAGASFSEAICCVAAQSPVCQEQEEWDGERCRWVFTALLRGPFGLLTLKPSRERQSCHLIIMKGTATTH